MWLIGGLETPRGTVGMGMEGNDRSTAKAGVGVMRWVVREGATDSEVAGIACLTEAGSETDWRVTAGH